MQTHQKLPFEISSTEYSVNSGAILGQGTFAVVLRGDYQGHPVAIKQSKRPAAVWGSIDTIACIKNEITIFEEIVSHYGKNSTDINAQCLLQFYGWSKVNQRVGTSGICIEVILEYANAGSLENFLFKRAGECNWTIGYRIFEDMTRGLKALHDINIVHRDMKEANILLERDASGIWRGKLCDFGLSKKIDDQISPVGSLLFIAPEILTKACPDSKKSDVYSLGITLFHMATAPETGKKIYSNFSVNSHDSLHQHVVNNKARDNFTNDTPEKIKKLTTWCWQDSYNARPMTDDILKELETGIDTISESLLRQKVITY